MEVVKSKNKQKVDQIDNEVTKSNNKNQNDEIINNNEQQQKKGKNKKKKNKQKNSHNNDKVVVDDEMSKQQKTIQTEPDQVKLQEEEEIKNKELNIITNIPTTTTIATKEENYNDKNGNNLLNVSQEDVDDENTNSPLSKPFIAPLAPMSTVAATTTTTTTIENNNNEDSHLDVDNDTSLCCPLTPRRIVDVQEEDEAQPQQYYDLKKSNTINSINNKSNLNQTVDDIENQVDNDFYDDEEYDDGDNGLLVQFLDEANKIAEAKLAQRRQARVEAREIRMRELERQQKEQEQNADRVFDLHTNSTGVGDAISRTRLTAGMASLSINSVLNSTRANSMCSRRSSEDSLEEEGRSLRDIRHELKDVEDRFRKAMIANAQLDNERASQTYQIQLLKDKLEEMEESYAQLQREFKDKSKECNAFKRQLDKVSEELKLVQGQLNERDTLIAEQGLVIVAVENEDGSDARRALVTVENAQLLGSVQGSLDVRLKKFSEEKQQLMSEVQRLQDQLENYKSHGKQRSMTNGPLSDDEYEAQREANKIISDYKYKLQKAEQEIASLQSSLARSETQVIRYKSTAEAAEKAEAELKIERRKLQRENREAMERLEELETENHHLLKRMDKLKNVKSALLKDL